MSAFYYRLVSFIVNLAVDFRMFDAKYKFHILQTLKFLSIRINSGSKTGGRYICVGSRKGDVKGLLQAIQIYLRGEQRMELKGRL